MEKFGRARQATDGDIALCMLDIWDTQNIKNLMVFYNENDYENELHCYLHTYIASLVFPNWKTRFFVKYEMILSALG